MPTVLIVDDSLTDRKLVAGLLTRTGSIQIQEAVDGRDALEKIELHMPDLVLTDLNMPDMDGLELVRAIRDQYPLVPVILMTAQGSEQIAVEALRRGAAGYVSKRKLADDLVDIVEQVLTASQIDRSHQRLMRRMRFHEVHFELENDQELISSVVKHLQDLTLLMNICDRNERVRIGVALQEALVNACYHGNLEISSALREEDHQRYYQLAEERARTPPYSERRIHIQAKLTPDEARYVIRDDGQGFDPSQIPDPRDPMNLERPCGRGLLLMQTFMDEVIYNERGNEVTLIKRRSSIPLAVFDDE
ncbi:MAG: hypothetical protein KatS3mg114_0287 [Planctomycetaceae bacterium]|nr:MAG: hypothetical protein KatS3mg114_0287 [Planctomycetaceae bacterium]